MKKVLRRIEKTTETKKPTALGGTGKIIGYGLTGIAWVFSRGQKALMEVDANIEPSKGVVNTYKEAWEIGLTDANNKIADLEKAIAKAQNRLSKTDMAAKPKKYERIMEILESLETELDRQVLLMNEFRKKLYKK